MSTTTEIEKIVEDFEQLVEKQTKPWHSSWLRTTLTSLATSEYKRGREDEAIDHQTKDAAAYEAGRLAEREEVRKMVEGMMDDEKRFPRDGWNDWEQGAYKVLEALKEALQEPKTSPQG